MTKYKFDEERLLKEIKEYIDSTYKEHYAAGEKIQVTEFIMSHLDTPDFLRGNVLKYAARYGMKEGYNRKDILKSLHYCLLLLCYHDRKYDSKDTDGYDPIPKEVFDPLKKWKPAIPPIGYRDPELHPYTEFGSSKEWKRASNDCSKPAEPTPIGKMRWAATDEQGNKWTGGIRDIWRKE